MNLPRLRQQRLAAPRSMVDTDRMLTIDTFQGSARRVGAGYGRRFQREIAGFFSQEFGSYRHSKPFVRACLRCIEDQAPVTAAFLAGLASDSLLSPEEHVLLLLHEEELYHRRLRAKKPHCTAVGVAAQGRKAGGAIVGQNWDWNTAYFPWAAVNRFAISRRPEVVALSYPGLPICAGLNSAGLALMWTGAGYYPPVLPKSGIPTYALVFETLLEQDVASALEYLWSVRPAGAFIFFLGDRRGNLAIVEGTPGRIFVEQVDLGHRANVFEGPGAIKASGQKLPGPHKCHSLTRNQVLSRCAARLSARRTISEVQSVLSRPTILIEKSFSHATLMQLVADCGRGALLVRPWRQQHHDWIEVRV